MTDMMSLMIWNTIFATLLAAALFLLTRARCLRIRPNLRHALWLLVFARFLTPPLIPLGILPATAISIDDPRSKLNEPLATQQLALLPEPVEAEFDASSLRPGAAASAAILPHLETMLLIASAIGTCTLLGLAIRQARCVDRLLSSAEIGSGQLRSDAVRIARAMGLSCEPLVRIVRGSVMPMLWISGRRPTIVLPHELLSRLNAKQIDCMLSHELAHYVRRDHWSNLFSLLVVFLFWWHPLVWLARRELRMAQELCCDGLVLARIGADRRTYAEMLFMALDFVNSERPLIPEIANGIGRPSSLERRFEMLKDQPTMPRLSWIGRIVVGILLATLPCLPTRGEVQKDGPESAASPVHSPSVQANAQPPTLEYLRFLGIKKIKGRVLAKETGLAKGDVLDPESITAAKQKIEDLYQAKGYEQVKVTVLEGNKPTDHGACFLIEEGKSQTVWKVRFQSTMGDATNQLKLGHPVIDPLTQYVFIES